MAAGDLCTLADVRLAMETQTDDTALDTEISALIPIASALIMRETGREFAPAVSAATRTIAYRPNARGLVQFGAYDLRAATTVTLNPEAAAPLALTADTDYQLLPVGKPDGVYTHMRLYSGVEMISDTLTRFGFAQLSILGDWGWAAVPGQAKQACVVTVRSWLRRDLSTYAQYDPDVGVQPAPIGTYALPLAAKSILRTLNRHLGVF